MKVITTFETVTWPLVSPFRVSHCAFDSVDVVRLSLDDGSHRGVGEVSLGPWTGIKVGRVRDEAQALVSAMPAALSLADLSDYLESTGASPQSTLLVEMAYLHWLCDKKRCARYQLLDLPPPITGLIEWQTVVVGAFDQHATPDVPLKIKLGSAEDGSILKKVRCWNNPIIVDVNRGWNHATFADLLPLLQGRPELYLEDPVADITEFISSHGKPEGVPILLDETISTLADIQTHLSAMDGANLKLQKAGGLLRARQQADYLRQHHKIVMLGCYLETPLAMDYAKTLAPFCQLHDLDGDSWLQGVAA